MYNSANIECRGYWLYQNMKTGIAIEKSNCIYGSGDYEDEIDKFKVCYYIWSSVAGSENEYKVGLGHKKTIEEAKKYAEEKCGEIVWE